MFLATSRCFSAAAVLLGVFVLMGAKTIGAQQKTATDEPTVDLQWAVKIPMRDGVHLNATLYRPATDTMSLNGWQSSLTATAR